MLIIELIMKAVAAYGRRKLKAMGIEQVVESLVKEDEREVGSFSSDGLCLWHDSYDFPIAVKVDGVPATASQRVLFVIVDPMLIKKDPSKASSYRELVLAHAYIRARVDYEAQLTPEGMTKVMDYILGTEEEDLPEVNARAPVSAVN